MLCPFNSSCSSKEIHWGCWDFTQGKGTNVPLHQGDSSDYLGTLEYSGGHFGTAIALDYTAYDCAAHRPVGLLGATLAKYINL